MSSDREYRMWLNFGTSIYTSFLEKSNSVGKLLNISHNKAATVFEEKGFTVFSITNFADLKFEDLFFNAINDEGGLRAISFENRTVYVSETHRILQPRGFLRVLVPGTPLNPLIQNYTHFARQELKELFEPHFKIRQITEIYINDHRTLLVAIFQKN